MKRAATVIAILMLLATPVGAQAAGPQTAAPQTPAAAQDGFVPVDSPISPEDAMPAPRLVAIAYGFIWVVLFGYLWSIRSRLGRVEREMAVVTRRVTAGGK